MQSSIHVCRYQLHPYIMYLVPLLQCTAGPQVVKKEWVVKEAPGQINTSVPSKRKKVKQNPVCLSVCVCTQCCVSVCTHIFADLLLPNPRVRVCYIRDHCWKTRRCVCRVTTHLCQIVCQSLLPCRCVATVPNRA